jgi:sRNA-binding regulator protein Hfq
MKDGMDSTAAKTARDPEPEFTPRKLIRPSLPRVEHDRFESVDHRPERTPSSAAGKRGAPAEQTHAESFYYQKQMQSRTPMVVCLKDGEEVQGWIEWYDRNCIKINRNGGPNLLIYKLNIKYIFKAGENGSRKS